MVNGFVFYWDNFDLSTKKQKMKTVLMKEANKSIGLETAGLPPAKQLSKLPIWAKMAGYFFGIGLVYVGMRFLLVPEGAERDFGLIYDQPGYSFHSTKGVRDLSWGLVITLLTIFNWRKPLAVVILSGSLVPVVDMLVVLSAPTAVPEIAWVHGLTAIFSWVIGYFLLRNQTDQRHAAA